VRKCRALLQKIVYVPFYRMRGVKCLLCAQQCTLKRRYTSTRLRKYELFGGNTGLTCRKSYMCCFAGCVEWKAYFVRMHIGLLYGNRAFVCGNAGLFCGDSGLFCRHSYVCTMLQDVWSGMPTLCVTMSCRRARTSPPRFPSPHYKRAFIKTMTGSQKSPCVLSKEPYILADKPCILLNGPCVLSKEPCIPHFRCKCASIKTKTESHKSPCILSKEPCILSKEPCILSKEPCILAQNKPRIELKEPCVLSKQPCIPNFRCECVLIKTKTYSQDEHQILLKERYILAKVACLQTLLQTSLKVCYYKEHDRFIFIYIYIYIYIYVYIYICIYININMYISLYI